MAGGIRRKSSLTTNNNSANNNNKRSRKNTTLDLGWNGGDDEIDSEDDDESMQGGNHRDSSSDSEQEEETLEAKKVRLAREYLQKIERGADESSSSSDSDNDDDNDDDDDVDRVGLKLQKQRLKREGVYESAVADKLAKRINAIHLDIVDKRTQQQQQQTAAARKNTALKPQQLAKEWVDHGHTTMLKGHDLTTTCVSLQADGSRAVSGSKDHSVMLWDVERSTKLVNLWEHWKKHKDNDNNSRRTQGQVLSVACSDDGRYAAVGRRDATVSIFDIRSGAKSNLVKTFKGHKSAITSLAFQTQSLQLFSGSEDRCIRYVILDCLC